MKKIKIVIQAFDEYGLHWSARIEGNENYFDTGRSPVEAVAAKLQDRMVLRGLEAAANEIQNHQEEPEE